MLPNRRPRLYHSGETADLDFVVRTLVERERGGVLFAVGASLGGNVLLKWLGEHPGQRDVRAAVALSTPFDLGASDRHLDSAIGRLYVGNFLATLRTKALAAVRRFPEAAARIDVPRTLSARTFWEFDDAANAPLHEDAHCSIIPQSRGLIPTCYALGVLVRSLLQARPANSERPSEKT